MPKTILLTGATDGLGLALAHLYAAQGHQLLLLGRRERPLTLPTAALYCQAELTQRESTAHIVQFLKAHQIEQLDLVIHNAGVGYYGRLADQSPANIEALVAVNLLAPMALTHALLPWLYARKGHLVFVSSVVSALPGPNYAVYSATKAALDGFVRSLRLELKGRVLVQLIVPGATQTGMHQKMGLSRQVMDWEKFPSAAAVAQQIMVAIKRPRAEQTIGVGNRLLRCSGRSLEWLLDPLLRRRQLNKTGPLPRPDIPGHAVITGAAAGIGQATALVLAQAGYRVTGIDVDEAQAQATAAAWQAQGLELEFIIADLSQAAAIPYVLDQLNILPLIDLFIHNAGISAVGRFDQIPWHCLEAVIALNLLAPLLLTAGILQRGRLNPGATWVFISSLAHFVSYPGAAVYAASKDGLASFARSVGVANEIPAQVLTVFPGPTRTKHAARYSPDNSREGGRMPPEQLANLIVQAVLAGQTRLIPGVGNRLLAAAGVLAPRFVERMMERAILRPLGDQVRV